MYIGFYNFYKEYNKNRIFENPSLPIGDDLMYPFFYLAQRLKEMGHKVSTIDMEPLEKFDAVVFVEFPAFKNKYFKKLIKNNFKNLYLIASESPIIRPDNYQKENHKYFKKIFTWNDNLVDNKKYFKLNPPNKIPEKLNFDLTKKEKLCCQIISHKNYSHPQELYNERIKAIRWFEKNHPEEFDLYGQGWDKFYFHGSFLGFNLLRLNRLKFLTKLLARKFPSYKGPVKSKKEVMEKYKFAVCYENCSGFPSYITEKISDCFFSGCVPIYLGAPNITGYIPADAFIDKRKFQSYEKLYQYIKNMPDKEYQNYLLNIKNFLQSEKFYPFTVQCFAETLIREIT